MEMETKQDVLGPNEEVSQCSSETNTHELRDGKQK